MCSCKASPKRTPRDYAACTRGLTLADHIMPCPVGYVIIGLRVLGLGYGFGYIITRSPYTPYSIYLVGTVVLLHPTPSNGSLHGYIENTVTSYCEGGEFSY